MICRVVLGRDWPGVVLVAGLGFGEKDRRGQVPFSRHTCVQDTGQRPDSPCDLGHAALAEWCPSGVSTIKPPPSSLPPVPSGKEVTLQPTPKPWDHLRHPREGPDMWHVI